VAASSPVGHTLQAAVPVEITPGWLASTPILRPTASLRGPPGLTP